jgi:hypothetical protein
MLEYILPMAGLGPGLGTKKRSSTTEAAGDAELAELDDGSVTVTS